MGTLKSAPKAALSSTSIADALFTKGQQRVLGMLFANSGRTFYANEIIALTGAGTGAVQRELARLKTAGLLTVSRIGQQMHYQANPHSPVFEELRALVLKTTGLADVVRAGLASRARQRMLPGQNQLAARRADPHEIGPETGSQ